MAAKTIEIQKQQIEFNPNINRARGFFKDREPDIGPPAYRRPPTPGDGNRLLQIIFFFSYTQQGRKILDANRSPKTAVQITADVTREITGLFGAEINPVAIDALIKAHIAGDKYVTALNINDAAEMAAQSTEYSNQICRLLGLLHDDAMAYEFSAVW